MLLGLQAHDVARHGSKYAGKEQRGEAVGVSRRQTKLTETTQLWVMLRILELFYSIYRVYQKRCSVFTFLPVLGPCGCLAVTVVKA